MKHIPCLLSILQEVFHETDFKTLLENGHCLTVQLSFSQGTERSKPISAGAIWYWFVICQLQWFCCSHLKEMLLDTKGFWPLWASTDLPACFPLGFPRQPQRSPFSGISSPCLYSLTLVFNFCHLLFPLVSVSWPFGGCCYFQEPTLFLAVRFGSCTVLGALYFLPQIICPTLVHLFLATSDFLLPPPYTSFPTSL